MDLSLDGLIGSTRFVKHLGKEKHLWYDGETPASPAQMGWLHTTCCYIIILYLIIENLTISTSARRTNCPLMVYFCWLVSAHTEYICFPCTAILAKSLHFSSVAFVAGKALGVSQQSIDNCFNELFSNNGPVFCWNKICHRNEIYESGKNPGIWEDFLLEVSRWCQVINSWQLITLQRIVDFARIGLCVWPWRWCE